MIKKFFLYISSVLFICFGSWIILSGIQEKNNLAMKQTYNMFQESIYRQAYYIIQVYNYNCGKDLSDSDMQRIVCYLTDLETEKKSLYSQITSFPSSMVEIKKQSSNLYKESEVLYDHFVTQYKNVGKGYSLSEMFDKTFTEAIKQTPDCSISRKEVRRKITGRSVIDDFLESF